MFIYSIFLIFNFMDIYFNDFVLFPFKNTYFFHFLISITTCSQLPVYSPFLELLRLLLEICTEPLAMRKMKNIHLGCTLEQNPLHKGIKDITAGQTGSHFVAIRCQQCQFRLGCAGNSYCHHLKLCNCTGAGSSAPVI